MFSVMFILETAYHISVEYMWKTHVSTLIFLSAINEFPRGPCGITWEPNFRRAKPRLLRGVRPLFAALFRKTNTKVPLSCLSWLDVHVIGSWNPICSTPSIPPDSKDHGAKMEPTWALSVPGRPHIGPMNLAIRAVAPENLVTKLLHYIILFFWKQIVAF